MTRMQWLALLAATLIVPASVLADEPLVESPFTEATPQAPDTAAATSVNWQQWIVAADSARNLVDAPVGPWGLLPDPVPDDYPPLPLFDYGSPEGFYGARAPWLIKGERYEVRTLTLGQRQEGETSWYGPGFHGRLTASGEVFDMHQLTAAHRTLPLPSFIRVTHLGNQQSVIVKVNDRGPYHGNRMLDLSYAAARRLGIVGTARVAIEPVEGGRTGHHRAGIALRKETVYSVLLGEFDNHDQAHLLQTRILTKVPPGIPVNIHSTPGPLQIKRVEVGPLLSSLEVNLLIRSLRAVRAGLVVSVPGIRPGR